METQNISLNEALKSLDEGKIEKLEFDILNHTISCLVKVFQSDEDFEIFNLVFYKVSSFYFVHDIGSKRFNLLEPESDDYKELTSMSWYRKGIGAIKVIASSEALRKLGMQIGLIIGTLPLILLSN